MTRTIPKGIFKRGRQYSVRYSVPTEFQPIVGRKEIVRSLGTSDLSEAIDKRNETLEEIRASLFADKKTRKAPTPPPTTKPFFAKAGRVGTTVHETAHRWLSDSDGITNSTRQRYRRILERFERFSGNPEVRTINREMALAYMDHRR